MLISSAHYETTKSKLETAEEHIQLIKEQLDDALENNDMIEQLTERNLKLSEVPLELIDVRLTA